MITRQLHLALAMAGALLLGACGGGGDGSGFRPGAASAGITVIPSLGSFSGACTITLRATDGSVLASAGIDADGSATLATGLYAGPLIVQLSGADDCRYYDEAGDRTLTFGRDKSLYAVVEAVRSPLGVNLLTHLAASRLLDGNRLAAGLGEDDIRRANATVQVMFQSGDILQAATPVRSRDDRLAFDAAGRLAARLAALAEIALSLARPLGQFATELAADFRDDGRLNTVPIDTARLRAGLVAAADKFSNPDSVALFATLAPNTTLRAGADDVQATVAQVLAAGPALARAQQLFADLRASGLSIAVDAGTADVVATVFETGFKSAVATGRLLGDIQFASEAARGVSAIAGGGFTSDSGFCDVGGALRLCRMHWSFRNQGYTVILRRLGDTQASWTVPRFFYSIFWNYDADGMTGRFNWSGDSTIVGGHYYPMTTDARRTAVDLVVVRHSGGGGNAQASGYGTLNAVLADDLTSPLKAVLGSFALDPDARITRFATTQTGAQHRFEGSAELTGLTRSLDGADSSPAGGRLTGRFSGIGANPPILEGRLDGAQDWSAYDATRPVSATNFPRLQFVFEGSAWPEAGKASLPLSLSADTAGGQLIATAQFRLAGSTGQPLACRGTRTNGGWTWTVTGDGVTADYSTATAAGSVVRTDGAVLGSLASGIITFIDGSFELLN